MLHTQFQASKPSGSEEENFLLIFFYVFQWFKPRTLWPGAILDPRDLHLNKLGKSLLGNATY